MIAKSRSSRLWSVKQISEPPSISAACAHCASHSQADGSSGAVVRINGTEAMPANTSFAGLTFDFAPVLRAASNVDRLAETPIAAG
jgi:hypothetical protein